MRPSGMVRDRGFAWRSLIAALLAGQLAAGVLVLVERGFDHARNSVSRLALDPQTASGAAAEPTPSRSPAAAPAPRSTKPPDRRPAAITRHPSAKPTTAEHRTTATAATGSSDEGGYGAPPPGSVIAPYRAGQTSWTVEHDGVRVSLSLDATPKVGKASHWHIATSMPGHYCCGVTLLYGDGLQDAVNESSACPDPAAKPTSDDVEFTHTYNRGGQHEFYLQVGPRGCSEGEEPAAYLFGYVDVSSGSATSNGPALPTVLAQSIPPGQPDEHAGDKSWVAVQASAEDRDGYITSWTFDFGDGTPPVHVQADAGPCTDGPDGWPQTNDAPFGQGAGWPSLDHHFTASGQYTVTYTAYSAGCDGKDVQHGSAHYDYYVP